MLVQLLHAAAHGLCMGGTFGGRLHQQITHRDSDEDTADGLPRSAAFKQAEKALPGLGIGLGITGLRGVASSGVDEHGFVGEPPVAVARATDAAHRVFAHR